MILSQLIHYPDTNSVEATWVDGNGAQVKCHSYADVQMDMLEADLGADAPQYAELIATVRANIQPPPPPPAPTVQEQIAAIEAQFTTTLQMRVSLQEPAAVTQVQGMYAQIAALKQQL